jgi:hypothetical protein
MKSKEDVLILLLSLYEYLPRLLVHKGVNVVVVFKAMEVPKLKLKMYYQPWSLMSVQDLNKLLQEYEKLEALIEESEVWTGSNEEILEKVKASLA